MPTVTTNSEPLSSKQLSHVATVLIIAGLLLAACGATAPATDGGSDCVAGAACSTNPGACRAGRISCSTGSPLCVDGTPKAAGVTCTGGVCDGAGTCNTCAEGGECSSNPDPCRAGSRPKVDSVMKTSNARTRRACRCGRVWRRPVWCGSRRWPPTAEAQHPHLRRAQHVACGMQRDAHAVVLHRLAVAPRPCKVMPCPRRERSRPSDTAVAR